MQHPEGMKKSRLAIALCPTLSISSSANWLAPSSDLYVTALVIGPLLIALMAWGCSDCRCRDIPTTQALVNRISPKSAYAPASCRFYRAVRVIPLGNGVL